MAGPYVVKAWTPPCCLSCGAAAPAYRVVDTRKKHGDRYPRRLQCKSCADGDAAKFNAGASAKAPKETG